LTLALIAMAGTTVWGGRVRVVDEKPVAVEIKGTSEPPHQFAARLRNK